MINIEQVNKHDRKWLRFKNGQHLGRQVISPFTRPAGG